jgi:hypothetical protein
MKVKFLTMLLIILFIGCARIDSGTVSSKEFVPAHKETYTTYTKVGDIKIPQQHTRDVPDKWFITFQAVGEDDKTRTRTVQVSKHDYDQYQIGDWISLE